MQLIGKGYPHNLYRSVHIGRAMKALNLLAVWLSVLTPNSISAMFSDIGFIYYVSPWFPKKNYLKKCQTSYLLNCVLYMMQTTYCLCDLICLTLRSLTNKWKWKKNIWGSLNVLRGPVSVRFLNFCYRTVWVPVLVFVPVRFHSSDTRL